MYRNDLQLSEDGGMEGASMDDFYESQPGDAISGTTRHPRRQRSFTAVGMLLFGALLLFGGLAAILLGGEEETPKSNISGQNPLKPIVAPTEPPKQPTEAPVVAPVAEPSSAPVEGGSASTSNSSLLSFLSSVLDEDVLLDAESIAHAAFTWMQGNSQLEEYSNAKLKQRFAVAALHLATNQEETWNMAEGWMSDSDECSWFGVECQDGSLIALNLTANGLEGLVPNEITLLSDSLLALEISNNDLANADEELEWMGELTSLRMLDIEQTLFAFEGLPTYLAKLTELRILDVSSALFIGELDGSIFAPMQELMYLEMGGNLYNSTLPQEIAKLPKLEALYAFDCGLEGEIDFISAMTNIFELWFDENEGLVGTIPTEIGTLTELASLSFSNCDLSGVIPTEIGKLTKMEQMWLFGNWLNGDIPTEIGLLTNLEIFGLEDNDFSGVNMPDEICDLDFIALSADCGGDSYYMNCTCCTCCEPPCPIANLPLYENRFLR